MKKYFIVAVFWLCSMGYAFGFDSTTVVRPEITKATANSTPLGSIMIWSSHSSPSDEWLECNGQSLVGYPALAALLGKSRAPDFRGIFLRGVGGNSAALGVQQGDAIRNIWGSMSQPIFDDEDSVNLQGAFMVTGIDSYNPVAAGEYLMKGVNVNFDASRVVPTSNENRPVNIAVRYFIKAKE